MNTLLEVDWVSRGKQSGNYTPHVWSGVLHAHSKITEEEAKDLVRIFCHGWHEGAERSFGDALRGRLKEFHEVRADLKMPGYSMWFFRIEVPYSD